MLAGWLGPGTGHIATEKEHTQWLPTLPAALFYIYVTHVYFWGNFNRLFRYWFARVTVLCGACDMDRFCFLYYPQYCPGIL